MKARILIVEDDPNIGESLDFILRRAEFDVELITDGAVALASCAKDGLWARRSWRRATASARRSS